MPSDLVHRAPEPGIRRHRHDDAPAWPDAGGQPAHHALVVVEVFQDVEGAHGIEAAGERLVGID